MSQQLVPPPWTAGHVAAHSASVVQLPHMLPPLLDPLLLPELPPLVPELEPELPPLLPPEDPELLLLWPPELDPELLPELLPLSLPASSPKSPRPPLLSLEPQAATRATEKAIAESEASFMGVYPGRETGLGRWSRVSDDLPKVRPDSHSVLH